MRVDHTGAATEGERPADAGGLQPDIAVHENGVDDGWLRRHIFCVVHMIEMCARSHPGRLVATGRVARVIMIIQFSARSYTVIVHYVFRPGIRIPLKQTTTLIFDKETGLIVRHIDSWYTRDTMKQVRVIVAIVQRSFLSAEAALPAKCVEREITAPTNDLITDVGDVTSGAVYGRGLRPPENRPRLPDLSTISRHLLSHACPPPRPGRCYRARVGVRRHDHCLPATGVLDPEAPGHVV